MHTWLSLCPFLLQVLPHHRRLLGCWFHRRIFHVWVSVPGLPAYSLDGGAHTSTGHLRAERAINSYPFLLSTFLPPIYCVPGDFTWRSLLFGLPGPVSTGVTDAPLLHAEAKPVVRADVEFDWALSRILSPRLPLSDPAPWSWASHSTYLSFLESSSEKQIPLVPTSQGHWDTKRTNTRTMLSTAPGTQ